MKRRATLASLCLAPWVLSGCAGSVDATHWYELRAEPPGPAVAPRPGDGAVWEVAGVVRLPGALDRDTLVVASGAATLLPLVGHRWVEPLRDSIPSRLVADLARLRGEGLVWRAPAPAGVAVGRRLRVQIDVLIADAARRSLRLQARWWLSDERADAAAPELGQANLDVPLADNSVDALAAGHRAAVWQLAQRIVA
ncbi:PqiC family protein [Hydrogenophaga sp.]|uniref:PqiC family protein n=1 Tax=Hydrogenophaga sp. TaxID=1904254 RepID=UPI003D134AC8